MIFYLDLFGTLDELHRLRRAFKVNHMKVLLQALDLPLLNGGPHIDQSDVGVLVHGHCLTHVGLGVLRVRLHDDCLARICVLPQARHLMVELVRVAKLRLQAQLLDDAILLLEVIRSPLIVLLLLKYS